MVFFGSSSCLSLLFGRLACIYSIVFFLFSFLLFSCGFRFVFNFRWSLSRPFHCLCSGTLSRRVPFHKCLSAFWPPLFSDASRDFSSGSSAFSQLFVGLPLLSLFLRCLQLLLLFLRWLRPPPLASLLLSLCLLLSLLPRGSLYLRSPFLRCLNWVGGCMRGVLHRCCLRLLQEFLLSPLPRHFCLCLLLQFLLPLFLLPSLRVLSSCLFSLALVFLGGVCLFCSWLGLSSAGLCGSLFTCGALPGAPIFSAASALPPFCSAPLAPLRVSLALPLRCLGLLRLLVYLR